MRCTRGSREITGLDTQSDGLVLSLYRSKFIHFEIYDRFVVSFEISSKSKSKSK